ncbi:MAG: carph-isopro domain-containing protein [Alphaproteobacteria bacterium]
MKKISEIIKDFGGLAEMSRTLDVAISTIQYWEEKNKIPYWRIEVVLKKAKELGLSINEKSEDESAA